MVVKSWPCWLSLSFNFWNRFSKIWHRSSWRQPPTALTFRSNLCHFGSNSVCFTAISGWILTESGLIIKVLEALILKTSSQALRCSFSCSELTPNLLTIQGYFSDPPIQLVTCVTAFSRLDGLQWIFMHNSALWLSLRLIRLSWLTSILVASKNSDRYRQTGSQLLKMATAKLSISAKTEKKKNFEQRWRSNGPLRAWFDKSKLILLYQILWINCPFPRPSTGRLFFKAF